VCRAKWIDVVIERTPTPPQTGRMSDTSEKK
jgi:hypothetical protein